jgi:hypothetical protein
VHERQQRNGTPERAQQKPVAGEALSEPSLLDLQKKAGNRAVAGLVAQRLKVGYPATPKSGKAGPVDLLDKAEPTGSTVGVLAPGEPAAVTAVPGRGQPWVEVTPLGAPGKKKGFAPAPQVDQAYDIKDDDVVWTTDKTELFSSPTPVKLSKLEKLKSLVKGKPGVKKELAKGTPVAIQGTASQGLVQAMVLEGTTPVLGYVEIKKVTAPNRKLGSDSFFHKKDKKALGDVKANKTGSRDESARLLHEGADERVAKIIEAIEGGLPALKAFNQVAYAIAGSPDIEGVYETVANRRLRRDLDIAFAGKPGPLAAPYLISMLDNKGRPSPKMAIALPLGKVDGAGAQGGKLGAVVTIFTTLMTGHPKAGKAVGDEIGKLAKDKRRVAELVGGLTPADIKALLADPEAMELINSADGKERLLQGRMEKVLGVSQAKEALDNAAPANKAQAEKDLAKARDELLAFMVRAATKRKDVPGFKQAHGAFQTLREKIKGTPQQKTPRLHLSFDLAGFHEDIVDWKKDATDEDRLLVAQPSSAFQHEWAKVPGTLLGVTEAEKKSLHDFIVKDDSKGKDLLLAAARQQITLQSGYAGREKDAGRGLGVRIRTAIVEKRWASIEQQVKDLDQDQREKLWTELGGEKGVEEALKAAGLNREERAGIMAMLGAKYGEAGGAYIELKQLVAANTRSEIGSRLAYLSPTKWSKAGTGLGSKGLGLAAVKIAKTAADEDFIQIRQDKALLDAIQARSDDKSFSKFLLLLGMKTAGDQLAETDDAGTAKGKRVLIDEARRAALHDPAHWGLLLDDQIDEGVIDKKSVSVGTDKAALYVLITQIQTTAREVGRRKAQEDPKADPAAEAQRFLNAVVSDLAKRHGEKPVYLRKLEVEKGYPVWSALIKNKPIPVGSWMARAEQEGFGVGSVRSTDRQKISWAFETMDGQQLLDDWSNLYVFKFHDKEALKAAGDLKDAEAKLDQDRQSGANEQVLGLDKIKVAQAKAHGARSQKAMTGFVLGINEDRRADLRTHVRKAEERIALEQMVTARLTKAMKNDPDVVKALEEAKLPNDEFMKAKMRAVDALESQRHLDTTRQWTAFSTAGSQLDEATRNVKASIGTTHHEETEARSQGKTSDEIAKLRKTGGKEAGKLLDERDLLEARFKDTQATFQAIADLLFTLVAQGLVMGLSMGLAAPLSIGIQIAITIGVEALRAAYKHFVLGDDDLLGIAMDFAMGVVAGTVKACTGNIAMALNASVLNPAASGLPQWFGMATSKSIGGLIEQTVMFAPEHFKERAMQEKALEKVIKEGEDDIGDAAGEFLKKAGKGVVKKMIMGFGKELAQDVIGTVKGEEPTQKPTPAMKSTNEAFRDAFSGGSSEARVVGSDGRILARGEDALRMQQNGELPPGARLENTTGPNGLSEEQEKRWKKMEKGHKKEAKKEAMAVVKTMKSHKHEKALEKDRHKLWVKDMKGDDKEAKSPALKKILDVVEADQNKKKTLAELIVAGLITPVDLKALDEDERAKVEETVDTYPGHIDSLVKQLVPSGK